MALYSLASRFYVGSSLPIILLRKALPLFYCQRNKTVDLEVDPLDTFTSELIQKKIGKWDIQKYKVLIKKTSDLKHDTHEIKIESSNSEQVMDQFKNALETDNYDVVIILVNLCAELKICPPSTDLLQIISICSQMGDKEAVLKITELCKIHNPAMLKDNSNFKDFVAEATWVKGDIPSALEIFETVYRENPYLRRRIRLMLKSRISDLVANQSEAALWNIIDFTERLLKEFKDFFPLTCVWQACFLSEWFTDQCTALELLERNDGLCKAVVSRIPYVVFVSLKCHRTEVVYRLLEILLKYKLKQQYSYVLMQLLDYQYRCGDYNTCAEIIHWTVENDVELPRSQYMKLLSLLLNERVAVPKITMESKPTNKHKPQLKF